MYGEIAWQINFLVLNCIEFFFKSCSSLVGKVSLAENLPFGENALVPLFTICPIASGFLYERARSDQIRSETSYYSFDMLVTDLGVSDIQVASLVWIAPGQFSR